MAATENQFAGTLLKAVSVRYLLYMPAGYDADEVTAWPLILFLHGAGERGEDLGLIRPFGPPARIERGDDLPFVVVAPQCPAEQQWDPDTLRALLDRVCASHRVDRDRVYLTGLSMGGLGTWTTAAAYPDRFAAIAPICGPSVWCDVRGLARLPVWCFHGARDAAVPVTESHEMARRIEEAGGDVRLTVYEDAEHDSWTRTYEDPRLYAWLLEHRRG